MIKSKLQAMHYRISSSVVLVANTKISAGRRLALIGCYDDQKPPALVAGKTKDMVKFRVMSRKLPYCETKRSLYFKPLIFGLKKEGGKRDPINTTWSFWVGYFFGEFNLKVTKHPN